MSIVKDKLKQYGYDIDKKEASKELVAEVKSIDKQEQIEKLQQECNRLNKLYHQESKQAIDDYEFKYNYKAPKTWYEKREKIYIKLKEKRMELENAKKS